MNYGTLIRDAWTTTWRHRSLWILGLLAGGTAGTIGGGRGGAGSSSWRQPAPSFGWDGAGVTGEAIGDWIAANGALIAAAVGLAFALGLGLLILTLIAQGGMAEATVDLARGRETSLGQAWRTGLRLFWRCAGLWLVLIVAAIAVAALIAAAAAFTVAVVAAAQAFGAGGPLAVAGVALAFLVGLPLVVALVAGAIALSIVVTFAQRAIYAEDAGPVDALRAGWRVLRAHVGESLLVWLINVALGIGAAIVGGLALLPVAAVLGGLGYLLWAVAGVSAPLIAYAAIAILAFLATGAVVAGAANTFFWNYWTRAYLGLAGGP